jgi:hypothetical protein
MSCHKSGSNPVQDPSPVKSVGTRKHIMLQSFAKRPKNTLIQGALLNTGNAQNNRIIARDRND